MLLASRFGVLTLTLVCLTSSVPAQDPEPSVSAEAAAEQAIKLLRLHKYDGAIMWIERWRSAVPTDIAPEGPPAELRLFAEAQRHLRSPHTTLVQELLVLLLDIDGIQPSTETLTDLVALLSHDHPGVRLLASAMLSKHAAGDSRLESALIDHLRDVQKRSYHEWKSWMGMLSLASAPGTLLQRYVLDCLDPPESHASGKEALVAAETLADWPIELGASERLRLNEVIVKSSNCDAWIMLLAYRYGATQTISIVLDRCDAEQVLWPSLRTALVAKLALLTGDAFSLRTIAEGRSWKASRPAHWPQPLGWAWTIDCCKGVVYPRRAQLELMFDSLQSLVQWSDSTPEIRDVIHIVAAMRQDWVSADRLSRAMQTIRRETGEWPRSVLQLLEVSLSKNEIPINPSDLKDYLGNTFRLRWVPPGSRLEGSGPDGKWGTRDDLQLVVKG